MTQSISSRCALAGLVLSALAVASCATNPATGKQQLSLYSEAQEIEMGRSADQQIVAQYGIVQDEELQRYVEGVGARLAADSERPGLPWTFRVLDDPVVNAFALPGGFVYVTRGILAHMGSEAELAAVLGHEIGHVTARHGVNRLSKAQLAQLGLGIGMIASPEMRGVLGDFAQLGMQLLFLKYSRDDERQADSLGFRYAQRQGYPPGGFVEVFATLAATSRYDGGGGRLPGYLTTHPAPEERLATARERLATLPQEQIDRPWRRDQYVGRLDGMVFGYDPRMGYFRGREYVHPDLQLRVLLPAGWKGYNQTQALVAMSPQQDAVFQLTLAGEPTVEQAANTFYRQQGLEVGSQWSLDAGLPLQAARYFTASQQGQQASLYGAAAFTEYGSRVYRLMTLATQDAWRRHQDDFRDTMASWSKLRDRTALDVKPLRIDLVRIDRAMDLEEFQRRYPSNIELGRLALINQVDVGETLAAGSKVKRVRGFDAGPMMGVDLH